MKPMEAIQRYPEYLRHGNSIYVPESVKNLSTEREVISKYDGRNWVSVFKDRVELMYQMIPYNYTRQLTHTSIRYNTVQEMVDAIETLTKIPQASCWE